MYSWCSMYDADVCLMTFCCLCGPCLSLVYDIALASFQLVL